MITTKKVSLLLPIYTVEEISTTRKHAKSTGKSNSVS